MVRFLDERLSTAALFSLSPQSQRCLLFIPLPSPDDGAGAVCGAVDAS